MSLKIFESKIFKSAYAFLSKLKKDKQGGNIQILEPLTTIITLAIISFKNIGTKIAVSSNKIYIQPPNVIQGPIRWTYGNNREEIHFLLKPIFRAIKIYKPNDNDDICAIFKYAIKGLLLLKNSYDNSSSTLCHAIDLYINLIDTSLKSPEINIDKYSGIEYFKNNLNLSQNTKVNLDKLFINIWKENEIKLISNMLKLSEANNLESKSYISAIESILLTKKNIVNNIILNTNKIF